MHAYFAQGTSSLLQWIKGICVNNTNMLFQACVSKGAFAGLATNLASKRIERKRSASALHWQKLTGRLCFVEPGTRSTQVQQAVCTYLCTSSKTGLSTM